MLQVIIFRLRYEIASYFTKYFTLNMTYIGCNGERNHSCNFTPLTSYNSMNQNEDMVA